MAGLRLGVSMLRQRLTFRDSESARPEPATAIGTDEDSIAMEVRPYGEEHAKYEFKHERAERPYDARKTQDPGVGMEACCHLIAGLATITAAVARLRQDKLPLEPDPGLSHAANFLYMLTGRRPTPVEERIMDVALILHADHGMNASTFACMVVASTLSDIYWAVGSGISALNGPLHGGANEMVVRTLQEIGSPKRVNNWFNRARARKQRVMGFGHRVYKAYDPRARVLGPLSEYLARNSKQAGRLYGVARALEDKVIAELGQTRKIFPNVDFFSGIVYTALGIDQSMFTPCFAVSRVSGWAARTMEYLDDNRIFRPRAMYTGDMSRRYVPMGRRSR
jgi:citrate synthase